MQRGFLRVPPACGPLLQLATAQAGQGGLPKQNMTKPLCNSMAMAPIFQKISRTALDLSLPCPPTRQRCRCPCRAGASSAAWARPASSRGGRPPTAASASRTAALGAHAPLDCCRGRSPETPVESSSRSIFRQSSR